MSNQDPVDEAIDHLARGELVVVPTETVYGLAADATRDEAVAGIYALKARPKFNPLIAHVPTAGAAAEQVVFDARARALATRFWPGPLTLVLPRRDDATVSLLASAGLTTQAVRVPAHPLLLELLQRYDKPLVAPSANRSGSISPTTPAHVRLSFADETPLILDGGPCAVGVESTIVDLSMDPARMLRPGAITRALLAEVCAVEDDSSGAVRAPGMLPSHYAPSTPLRLEANAVESDEGLLAFGEPLGGAAQTEQLSASGDLREAAARLFAALHRLDQAGLRQIAVMPIPDHGLGEAINDRLRRAAAPRP